MKTEQRKKWDQALAIIDDNLGVEDGKITNRFATSTMIIGFAEQYQEELKASHESLIEALEELMECYESKGQLLSFDVSIARKVLEKTKPK